MNDTLKIKFEYQNEKLHKKTVIGNDYKIDSLWDANGKLRVSSIKNEDSEIQFTINNENGKPYVWTSKIKNNFETKISKSNCLTGLYDTLNKKWITEPQYSEISLFINNIAIVSKDGKYGIIDSTGKTILPLQNYKIQTVLEYQSKEFYVESNHFHSKFYYTLIEDEEKFGLFHIDKGLLLKPDFDYIHIINADSFLFVKNHEIGISSIHKINTKTFYKLYEFSTIDDNLNNIFSYRDLKFTKYNWHKALLLISINKLDYKGLINSDGKTLIPFKYLEILPNFEINIIWAKTTTGFDIYNIDGKLIKTINGYIEEKYERSLDPKIKMFETYDSKFGGNPYKNNCNNYIFSNNKVIKNNQKYSIYNPFGDVIFTSDNNFKLKSNNEYCIIKQKQKFSLLRNSTIILEKLDTIVEGIDNNFIIKNNGKYGIANEIGEIVIPLIYDEIDFIENNIKVKFNGNYGLINLKNQIVIPIKYPLCINECLASNDLSECIELKTLKNIPFSKIFNFNNYTISSFKSSKKQKFSEGLIDNKGNIIVSPNHYLESCYRGYYHFIDTLKNSYLYNEKGTLLFSDKLIKKIDKIYHLNYYKINYENNTSKLLDSTGTILCNNILGKLIDADAKYLYVTTNDDKVKVLDYQKNDILKKDYPFVSYFDKRNGTIWVSNSTFYKNTVWTLLNSKGKTITKKIYQNPFEFKGDFAIGKTAKGLDLINAKGKILAENQTNIELNHNLIYIANAQNQISVLDSTLKPIYPRTFKSYTILNKNLILIYEDYLPILINRNGTILVNKTEGSYTTTVKNILNYLNKFAPETLTKSNLYLPVLTSNNTTESANYQIITDKVLEIKNNIPLANILLNFNYLPNTKSSFADVLTSQLEPTFNFAYQLERSNLSEFYTLKIEKDKLINVDLFKKDGYSNVFDSSIKLRIVNGKYEVFKLNDLLDLNPANTNILAELIHEYINDEKFCTRAIYDSYTINKEGITFKSRNEYSKWRNETFIPFSKLMDIVKDKSLLTYFQN